MSANNGLQADPLFVAATRPPMRFGVTTFGMVLGGIAVIEMFLVTKNLLWLLAYIPIHGVLALLLMTECRFFELLTLCARTKGLNWIKGNPRHWQASSYSPLRHDLSDLKGRRRHPQRDLAQYNGR
jgi:type IV secretion system protein VirB3